jgi:hypothetical protein
MVTVADPQQGKKIVYATHGKIAADMEKIVHAI